MGLQTVLRVLIEGDASGLIGQFVKAGRESKNVFSEVSRSAKAEFTAATREADKAFKEVARLQRSAITADTQGRSGYAQALRSQAAAKSIEAEKFAAVAIAADRRIQAESAKTVSAHSAQAVGVSKLGAAYAQQGGAVSRFLGSFSGSPAAAKSVTGLKDAVTGLGKGTGLLSGFTSVATTGLGAMATKASAAGPAMAGVAAAATGAAIGIGALAKITESGLKHFINYGAEVNKVKRITGATAEDASLLAGQFRHFGLDVDVASKSLGIFAKGAVNEGGKKLTDLGIAITRTKDGQVDLNATLLNAGDTFKSYGKGAEGTNLALQAFGRSGANLIPILAAERSELEAINRATSKQGLKFNDKDLKDARELRIAVRGVHHSFEGLQVSAAKGLAPFFTKQTEGAANLLDSVNSITQKIGGLSALAKVGSSFTGLVGLPGVSNILDAFGGKTTQAAKDQAVLQEAISETDEQASGFVAKMLAAGYSIEEVNLKISQSGKSVEELSAGASVAPVFDALAHSITRTGNAAKFAGEESDTFKAKLEQMGQGAISLQATQTSVAGSLDDLNTALKDNGRDFDNNTEKGRSNREALAQHASGILANVTAMQSQGRTVGEVSAAWDSNVVALTNTMRQAGLTDAQIQSLLTDYGLIPATKNTLIEAQTAEAKRRLAEVIAQLNQLQKTDVSVNISGGIAAGAIRFGGSSSTARAMGGAVKKGEKAEVGERGAELFIPKPKGKGHKPIGAVAHLAKEANKGAQETLVRLGVPGGIKPKATKQGSPALLLGTQGPQMFTPAVDGVVVNATDTKRLQRTEDEGVIARILKKAGADKRTLDALARASTPPPARAQGGRVGKGETYQVGEGGIEAFAPKFEFNAPRKPTQPVTGPGIKRGSDGSYTIVVGDTHLKVEADTTGSAKGINKRDVDRIVERKQAELVQELTAALRSG